MSEGEVRVQSAPGGQRPRMKRVVSMPPVTLIGRSANSSKLPTRGAHQHRGLGMHKGYFETLKPSELGNLHNIFERVDPGHTGFVMMDDFLGRLDNAKSIDHFLKRAHNFLMHSISAERRMGFKSFRDIIALLLPTASPAKVDAIIEAGEQWNSQKAERRNSTRLSTGRLSFSERMQMAAKKARLSRAFEIDKDSEESEEEMPKEHISLSNLQELKYMFTSLDRNGNGLVNVRDLERYFGTQDDIRSLCQRQKKLSDHEVQDMVLDFDGFLKLMLPNGFQPCSYPDPDKVQNASSEQIFRWLHDENAIEKSTPSQSRKIAPATENSAVEQGKSNASLSSSSSIPSLPSVPTAQLRRWRRTPLESRTLK